MTHLNPDDIPTLSSAAIKANLQFYGRLSDQAAADTTRWIALCTIMTNELMERLHQDREQ